MQWRLRRNFFLPSISNFLSIVHVVASDANVIRVFDDVQRRTSETGGEMLKKSLVRKASMPAVAAAVGVGEGLIHSCTIRFLDDSEPMSLTFKVAGRNSFVLTNTVRVNTSLA